MANKNRHKIVAVFVCILGFFFLNFFVFFLLVSPYFLLFHDILEPQNSPPNEVTGYNIYIHIYIYIIYIYLFRESQFVGVDPLLVRDSRTDTIKHLHFGGGWALEDCPITLLFLLAQWPPAVESSSGRRNGNIAVRSGFVNTSFAGVLRGNTIRGNTTRNSERKMALWEGLWEGLWKTSENL